MKKSKANKGDRIKSMLDTAPYYNAVNLCLHGVITPEEMAVKVRAWANGIIAEDHIASIRHAASGRVTWKFKEA